MPKKSKTLTESDLRIIESYSKKNMSETVHEADNSHSFGSGRASDNKKGE